MLSCIWAEAQNRIIGNQGKIPWNEPADMHHFVKNTMHKRIVFGRNTYKSFPPKGLPHRTNIVISKYLYNHKSLIPSNLLIMNNINAFLKYANEHDNKEIMICGGTSIYKQLLPYTHKLYRTVIKHNFTGDKKAVSINYDKFTLVSQEEYDADEKNPYPYIFQTWIRK